MATRIKLPPVQQGCFLSQQQRTDSFSYLTFESGLCLLFAGDVDQEKTRGLY
jgi:hypothetical protein